MDEYICNECSSQFTIAFGHDLMCLACGWTLNREDNADYDAAVRTYYSETLDRNVTIPE